MHTDACPAGGRKRVTGDAQKSGRGSAGRGRGRGGATGRDCGFKHCADSWRPETRMIRVAAGRPGRELGGHPGNSRSRPRLRRCEGTGSKREPWPGPPMPARAKGQSTSSPVLPVPPVWVSMATLGPFPFQVSNQCMEQDPGLGACSSGESSLRGPNEKSCN